MITLTDNDTKCEKYGMISSQIASLEDQIEELRAAFTASLNADYAALDARNAAKRQGKDIPIVKHYR